MLYLCFNVFQIERTKAMLFRNVETNYISFEYVGKQLRIVILHNETNEEPYKIDNVTVLNTFNPTSNECISASGSFHVVLTQTRNPSEEDQQKISDGLKNLGIHGLKLTDLSG